MAKKIYISPSNQYSNTYATGNTNEKAQCDKIANATATALKRCGFEVKVGKSGDTMQNRCVESDNFKADIHMPIHTNAYNGKVTGGTRIFCLNSNGKKACDAVLKYLGAISPGTADSVKYHTGLYEINVPNALTIYVEVEFHDTKTGSDWIRSNTTNIGEAIAKGLCDYFGYTYKSASSSSKKVLDSQ
ncbi:MAG: N-acetylmuramoyl-L-alanine amidase [Ruminococcus sp.]|nr:N-acetylmuramoyl-L-alanine amidase [Ruminococcus sp.]